MDVPERGHRSHSEEMSALLKVAALDRPKVSDDYLRLFRAECSGHQWMAVEIIEPRELPDGVSDHKSR